MFPFTRSNVPHLQPENTATARACGGFSNSIHDLPRSSTRRGACRRPLGRRQALAAADGRPSAVDLYARKGGQLPAVPLAAKTLRPSSVNRQVLYVVCCSALQHTTVQSHSRPRHEAGPSFARTSSCSIAISGEAGRVRATVDHRTSDDAPRAQSPVPTMTATGARARIAASDDVIHSLTLEGPSGGRGLPASLLAFNLPCWGRLRKRKIKHAKPVAAVAMA